jgi:hypothetical protein
VKAFLCFSVALVWLFGRHYSRDDESIRHTDLVLSPEAATILESPQSVVAFRPAGILSTGEMREHSGDEFIGGFLVEERGPNLSQQQTKKLTALLLDQDTRWGHPMQCMFTPEIGFRLYRNSDSADVLVCFCTHTFAVQHAGQPAWTFCEPAERQFKKLGKELFPRSAKF